MEIESATLTALRRHHLLAGLCDSDFQGLARGMSARVLKKGEFLFHRGDPATVFFFVAEGQVELAVSSPSGEKKVLEVVQPGYTFAEAIAFMTPAAYPVTAAALSHCRLVQVPTADYIELLRSAPEACFRLLADVCRRLHSQVKEIERLTVQNARGRLSSFLIDHVTTRDGDQASVHLEYPRRVIASRLYVKPETLSRMLRAMVDENLISVDDNVVHIHSVSALRPYG